MSIGTMLKSIFIYIYQHMASNRYPYKGYLVVSISPTQSFGVLPYDQYVHLFFIRWKVTAD